MDIHIGNDVKTDRLLHSLEAWEKIAEFARLTIKSIGSSEYSTWINHADGVQNTVWFILTTLRKEGLLHMGDDDIIDFMIAAFLHDIGKLVVPLNILNKPVKLTDEELEIVRRHVLTGKDFIESLWEQHKDSELYRITMEMIEFHHENWDGTGYLKGLKQEEIPMSARICAIADTYTALIEGRPYKKPLPHNEALNEIIKLKNSKFDPTLTDIFLKYGHGMKGLRVQQLRFSSLIYNTRRTQP